jgi:two-component system, LuxR family, sensor kinase FixL
MNWVTVIWSTGSGACLTLALIHFVVWWKDRTARANLVFSVMAIAVAAFAALELAMMRAQTPEQFGIAVRWVHVPVWVIVVSLVIFVRLYLNAGRRWLAWTVVGVRTLSLILNFIFSPNINFRQMAPLRHVSFLGESVAIATGVPNPWMVVAQLSLVLLVIFVTDATITVWRRGDRRQALMVGGSILLFTIAGAVEGITITWGIISMPLTVSLFYQSLVAVMACELSFDVLRATALARQLQASEASMGESEERFRIVANAAPVLIWMSGMDKLCTFFNKPWLEFTGRSMEQEMGNGWAEGVHPGDLQRCLNIYTEAFDDRRPFVMQYRLRRHDGEYRWISDQGVARYDTHENFAGYIGSCVDVTELINKDAELRESEERMRLAADAVNLGIWEWDLDKDEIWATNSRRALLGWPTSGKVGFEDFISCVHPDDRNRIQEAIDDAINKHKDYDSEYRLVLPDGVVRWMATRGSLHLNANGRPMRLLGVSIDITARKQAELETKQQRDELGHLSRVAAMGELAASIAHELNQPLAGITSNASAGQRFIDRGDVDLRELHDLLGDIVSDGRRAGDVIRSLQSMVKKAAPNRQRVNLNDLVTNVARMVNPNAVLQSCKVETLLEPNLPAIEADPIQLQQVLLNLVINAFDAMSDTLAPNRKVMIATERNGHGTIRTSVRDYGSGISEETRERLFEQFFTTKAKGLGMGLAIVRSIVESHGGTIAAENADGGVGARFQFILPVNGGPPE